MVDLPINFGNIGRRDHGTN